MTMPENPAHPLLKKTQPVARLYLLPTVILVVVYFLSRNQISSYELFADPTEIANQPPYIGLFSRLGNLVWCATSSICLFSSVSIRKISSVNRRTSLFLGCSGLLLGIFLLDDYFEIHEYVGIVLSGARDMYDNTVSQTRDFYEGLVILIYAIVFSIYLLGFRTFFLKNNPIVLVLSITFFIISVVIDLAHFKFSGATWAEDGAKFLGIWGVFFYFTDYCKIVQEEARVHNSFELRSNVYDQEIAPKAK